MASCRPKLLFISQNLPKRFASSGVMRLYFFVKLLCRDFDVTVAAYYMPSFDRPEDVRALEALGAHVESVHFDYPREGSDRFSPKLPTHVRGLLARGKFDVIHLERFWMRICLEDVWDDLTIPVILDEMDVEFKREERRLALQGGSEQELLDLELHKQRELKTCRQADHVITVTEADRRDLLDLLPGIAVTVIPTGQDVAWLNAPLDSQLEPRPREIVFCGDYRHNPNVDAALHLATDIWPLIRARLPEATLTLLGGNPPEQLLALHCVNGMEVPGWLDDLRPHYRRATVALAPIRFGSGIKAKLVEAAACGIPVATTSVGAEGLPFVDGQDMLIEDDHVVLAEKTIALLSDEKYRRSVAANGQAKALAYDWEALYPGLRDIYLSSLDTPHA